MKVTSQMVRYLCLDCLSTRQLFCNALRAVWDCYIAKFGMGKGTQLQEKHLIVVCVERSTESYRSVEHLELSVVVFFYAIFFQ